MSVCLPYVIFSVMNCLKFQWDESSWFPAYRSRPCICPECGAYIGWEFQPLNDSILEESETFFSFILTNIIGESCKYSLFSINLGFVENGLCFCQLTIGWMMSRSSLKCIICIVA